MKIKYVIAYKDPDKHPGIISQGKKLAEFRKIEFAEHAFSNIVEKECTQHWRIGIFTNGKLLD